MQILSRTFHRQTVQDSKLVCGLCHFGQINTKHPTAGNSWIAELNHLSPCCPAVPNSASGGSLTAPHFRVDTQRRAVLSTICFWISSDAVTIFQLTGSCSILEHQQKVRQVAHLVGSFLSTTSLSFHFFFVAVGRLLLSTLPAVHFWHLTDATTYS